jgi:hypothetical protein
LYNGHGLALSREQFVAFKKDSEKKSKKKSYTRNSLENCNPITPHHPEKIVKIEIGLTT